MRRSGVEKRAEELLGVAPAIPVEVEQLAKSQGIRVVYKLYQGDTSGLLIHEPDGTRTIGVNTFHSETRQRFTIAHELGHALLHLKDSPRKQPEVVVDKPQEVLFRDGRSSTATDRVEVEANQFAAALLMPRDRVHTEFNLEVNTRKPHDVAQLIEALAARFEVSAQAMNYRLINLNLLGPD